MKGLESAACLSPASFLSRFQSFSTSHLPSWRGKHPETFYFFHHLPTRPPRFCNQSITLVDCPVCTFLEVYSHLQRHLSWMFWSHCYLYLYMYLKFFNSTCRAVGFFSFMKFQIPVDRWWINLKNILKMIYSFERYSDLKIIIIPLNPYNVPLLWCLTDFK